MEHNRVRVVYTLNGHTKFSIVGLSGLLAFIKQITLDGAKVLHTEEL